MKKSLFRDQEQYFHMNVDFCIHPILKELDWVFVQREINKAVTHYQGELHALVMMDTHVHLLIGSLGNKENYFCEDLKLAFSSTHSQIDGHCEPITNYAQYLNAYKYIYRNPVEAGLAKTVQDYSFSTVQSLLGRGALRCQIFDHLGLIQNPQHIIKWLNNEQDFKISRMIHPVQANS